MRTRPISEKDYKRLLKKLKPRTALAVRISRDTGLRVSDVLGIKAGEVRRTMHVVEQKTDKVRQITLSANTLRYARTLAKQRKPDEPLIGCNRSTLYRDIRQAAEELGLAHVSMHSFRKMYARRYARERGIDAAQQELQHRYLSTTLLYLVDENALKKLLEDD